MIVYNNKEYEPLAYGEHDLGFAYYGDRPIWELKQLTEIDILKQKFQSLLDEVDMLYNSDISTKGQRTVLKAFAIMAEEKVNSTELSKEDLEAEIEQLAKQIDRFKTEAAQPNEADNELTEEQQEKINQIIFMIDEINKVRAPREIKAAFLNIKRKYENAEKINIRYIDKDYLTVEKYYKRYVLKV